jgi:hypothetical protein
VVAVVMAVMNQQVREDVEAVLVITERHQEQE